MAVRTGGPAAGGRSDTPGAAVWISIFAIFVTMLGGVSPFGVARVSDVPQLAAVVAALALAAGVSRPLRRLWRTAQARRIELPALAVLVAAAVAAFYATDRAASLLGEAGSALGFLTLALLLLAGLSAAWLSPQVRSACTTAAPWIVTIQIAVTTAQLVRHADPSGTFSEGSQLAMAVAMLVPATLAPVVAGGKLRYDRPAVVRMALAGAAVVVLGLAGSRVGTAAALAGVAWMLTPVVRRLSKDDRRTVPAIVGAVSLTLGAAVLLGVRLLGGVSIADLLGPRPQLWSGSVRLIGLRPLLGWGPDSFQSAFARIATVSVMREPGFGGYGFEQLPTDPHNLLLAAAVSFGIAGVLALGWLTVAIVRTWRGERRTTGRLAWPAVSVSLFLAVALVSPVGLQVLPLLALVLGASVPLGFLRSDATAGRRTAVTIAGSSAAWLTRTVCVLACLVVAASAITHLWIGPSRQSSDIASSLKAQQAARFWQYDPYLYHVESVRWSLTAAGGASSAFAPATAASRRAVLMAPSNPFYGTQYANSLFVSQDPLRAAIAYQQVLAAFPNSPDAVEGVGYSLLAAGIPQRALEYADRALVLAPRRSTAHRLAAEVYRAIGDETRANKEAAIADKLLPK